jgi:precorrin-2/cobalt-factor-2 C20-methyltransferase
MTDSAGILYGVGVGPGDPGLITLKAARCIERAAVVAYPANMSNESQARDIATAHIRADQKELPIHLEFSQDRTQAEQAYDQAARTLARELDAGLDVVVLCEGDPLLYGSFIYLWRRLRDHYPVRVIPGITSIQAVAAAARRPLAVQDQTIAILPASAPDGAILHALHHHDCVALMKPGRHRARLLTLIEETGRSGDTVWVEQASRDGERVVRDISTLPREPGPYFAMLLVSRPL